jgi:hypothetical protein
VTAVQDFFIAALIAFAIGVSFALTKPKDE